MAEFDEFPDAEDLSQAILATATTWSPYVPHVGTKLPTDPEWVNGVITVSRTGGMPVEEHRLDGPRIDVNVWHERKFDAHKLAQRARVLLLAAAGKTISGPSGSGFVSEVRTALAVTWMFDSLNNKPRYTFSVRMVTHI